MSRIGKKPVPISTAKVNIKDRHVSIEGPKGKLERTLHPLVSVTLDAAKKELVVTRADDTKASKAQHGTARAILANMIEGVVTGYKKSLEIQGVGYKAEMKGKNLVLSVGFANPVSLSVPMGVQMTLEGTTKIHLAGPDKQLVGQFASDIRRVRKPEPYKGKGIRYDGEKVKIKPGKAFAGAGAGAK
jgi:large subunit ribosomal protein L6